MSEFWVSHKRYHCKYCNIYIADDKPSRAQHENGLRHKGNVERFVRGLYKDGEKRVREREEEKGVMAVVGKAAEAAYALDVASGRAGGSSSSTASSARAPPPPAPKPKPAKPTNPYANYTTAASLGITDPDAEEAERRREMGIPGEWSVVTPTPPPSGTSVLGIKMEDGVKTEEGQGNDEESKKRPAPTLEVDEEDTRAFKLQKKTVSLGLGEIYDPGLITIKLKAKKETEELKEDPQQGDAQSGATTNGTIGDSESQPPALKWTKVQWKKASDDSLPPPSATDTSTELNSDPDTTTDPPLPCTSANLTGTAATTDLGPSKGAVKPDSDTIPAATVTDGVKKEEEPSVPPLAEPTPQAAQSMFRKRKLPAGRR
ncbi:hypothetical protein HYDPIDRAFT_165741 [Hydnomerulius pinastri MD-312]|nr:hypothetical protein HYDPIDRAFT_165741 [Hydnomerulius pinastri MD-312]